MKTRNLLAIALLAAAPLFTAQAADGNPGIGGEIRQELANARKEVRIELAKAKQELDTGNLRLDNGFQFGAHDTSKSKRAKADLARAEITPRGDLLIDGSDRVVVVGNRQWNGLDYDMVAARYVATDRIFADHFGSVTADD